MKRYIKITILTVFAILLIGACVIGGFFLAYYLPYYKTNPTFEETTIFPDNKLTPPDTVLTVNGIDIGFIGIRSGKICCLGLRDTIKLKDFYIAETEVTQQLWKAIMGSNPSINHQCDSLPVENINLNECVEFVHKLDSISGFNFSIPSLPQWLYAAYLGNCNSHISDSSENTLDDIAWWENNSNRSSHLVKQKTANSLGLYDMIGNVKEWTLSGSDPLFYVAGGGYDSDRDHCEIFPKDIYHADVTDGSTGLRLTYYPSSDQ